MFTQQARLLANNFGPSSTAQGAMQALGNCAQPLATRGPVRFDAAARSKPPRAGVIPSLTNAGGLGVPNAPTGSTLTDYQNGWMPSQWNQHPGSDWNPKFFSGLEDNSFYSGDSYHWGGDTFYGDRYLSDINVLNQQSFVTEMVTNPSYFETYHNQITNNLINQNLNEWYTQQFVDQSYNDFSTNIDATSNFYQQSVNNFAGDNYFDNTVTTNNTVNNNVTNEGDVYNNSGVYMDARRTFITDNRNVVQDLRQWIVNVMAPLFPGGGGGGVGPGRPPAPQQPQRPGGFVTVPKAVGGTVNEDCTITLQYADVRVPVRG